MRRTLRQVGGAPGAVHCPSGWKERKHGPPGLAEVLRKLSPRQEKVTRMYYGLGCQRPHSAPEMAQEFGVSEQVIAALLGAAQRRLAREGLSAGDLREAARQPAEVLPSAPSERASGSQFRHPSHSHHVDSFARLETRARAAFDPRNGRLVLLTNGVAAREPRRISPILAQVATSGSRS